MYQLKTTFEHYFPEGSTGGQCAVFTENLIKPNTPNNLIGEHLQDKINTINQYGIKVADLHGQFMIGDIIIFDYNPDGHVCILNSPENSVSESNFHLDGLVHHTRIISLTDPHIIGVLRGTLKVNFLVPIFIANIKLVMNDSNWPSLNTKISDTNNYLLNASRGRLAFRADIEFTSFKNIPYINNGGIPMIDRSWYDQNIIPKGSGYDFITFQVPTNEAPISGINGYTDPESLNLIKTEIKSDENETISSPTFPAMSVFINTFLHENFGHGIRKITGQLDLRPDNTFLVHDFLDNTHGKFDLTGLLDILDYSTLIKKKGINMTNSVLVKRQMPDGSFEYGFFDPATKPDGLDSMFLNRGLLFPRLPDGSPDWTAIEGMCLGVVQPK